MCSLCPKTLLLFPAPNHGWALHVHCPALGAAGPCHPASAVFCTHPPSNHRRCKVKENLTPNVHCIEGSWSSLSPRFSHPFLGNLLGTPSAFLLLSATAAISAISTQQLGIQVQPGIAHSTQLLTLIHVPVGQWPSCPGATPSPMEASGMGEMV